VNPEEKRGQRAEHAAATSHRPLLPAVTWLQGAAALWLLLTPWALPGPNQLVDAKDVTAGILLLAVTTAAALSRRVRRLEGAFCLALGVLLIAASLVFEFGPGEQGALRQWSEVVVGVLLIYLAARRAT
jgi:hypothetical protein